MDLKKKRVWFLVWEGKQNDLWIVGDSRLAHWARNQLLSNETTSLKASIIMNTLQPPILLISRILFLCDFRPRGRQSSHEKDPRDKLLFPRHNVIIHSGSENLFHSFSWKGNCSLEDWIGLIDFWKVLIWCN